MQAFAITRCKSPKWSITHGKYWLDLAGVFLCLAATWRLYIGYNSRKISFSFVIVEYTRGLFFMLNSRFVLIWSLPQYSSKKWLLIKFSKFSIIEYIFFDHYIKVIPYKLQEWMQYYTLLRGQLNVKNIFTIWGCGHGRAWIWRANCILFFINISLIASKIEHLFMCMAAYKFILLWIYVSIFLWLVYSLNNTTLFSSL